MTHDPMCDWWTEQCKIDCSEYGSYDPCPHDSCLCDLIAKVRDDERWATVEGAVFIASQYGADPELVQLLSRMYEVPGDALVRREAARELTQLAQEMGLIP